MQWKDFRDFTLTLHVPPEPPGLVSDLCGYIGTQSGSCCYGPTVRYSTVGLGPALRDTLILHLLQLFIHLLMWEAVM